MEPAKPPRKQAQKRPRKASARSKAKALAQLVKAPKKRKVVDLEKMSEDYQALIKRVVKKDANKIDPFDIYETNTWLCLVFDTFSQKREFMAKLPDSVSVKDWQYADGEAFAEFVGIPLTPANQPVDESKIDKRLTALAFPLVSSEKSGILTPEQDPVG